MEIELKIIKIAVGTMLTTIILMYIGTLIHEGAHIFVASCLGCETYNIKFTGLLGIELRINVDQYRAPIAFAGAFAEGWYILGLRKVIKSQGLWMATACFWIYALAEISMCVPVLILTRDLAFIIFYASLVIPKLNTFSDLKYQRTYSIV